MICRGRRSFPADLTTDKISHNINLARFTMAFFIVVCYIHSSLVQISLQTGLTVFQDDYLFALCFTDPFLSVILFIIYLIITRFYQLQYRLSINTSFVSLLFAEIDRSIFYSEYFMLIRDSFVKTLFWSAFPRKNRSIETWFFFRKLLCDLLSKRSSFGVHSFTSYCLLYDDTRK